jgi:hypothetical protein
MNLELTQALWAVKAAVIETANKATHRRLALTACPCHSGCSACCSRLVYASVAEFLLIQEELTKDGTWSAVRQRSQNLIRLCRIAAPLAWFKMNLKCPVLDPKSQTCMSYAIRPPACSIHWVSSSPTACDPWSLKPESYERVMMDDLFQNFSETLAKAVDGHGIFGMILPMPIGLLFAERIRVQRGLSAQEIMRFIHNECGRYT